MEPISVDQIFQLLLSPSFERNALAMFLKVMFMIAFALYIAFALIVVKQVFMMTHTIKTSLEPLLKIFALSFLLLSIGVFLFVMML